MLGMRPLSGGDGRFAPSSIRQRAGGSARSSHQDRCRPSPPVPGPSPFIPSCPVRGRLVSLPVPGHTSGVPGRLFPGCSPADRLRHPRRTCSASPSAPRWASWPARGGWPGCRSARLYALPREAVVLVTGQTLASRTVTGDIAAMIVATAAATAVGFWLSYAGLHDFVLRAGLRGAEGWARPGRSTCSYWRARPGSPSPRCAGSRTRPHGSTWPSGSRPR